ncbi:MAG: hypothetical protein KAH99_07420, partial [Verrucomicrobia bacterium]|nr:hypothetical protein [Verrucomicrobiota bacterium]
AGSPAPSATIDGIVYTIQGVDDLQLPQVLVVLELIPALDANLPALSDIAGDGTPDWEYRTFRLQGSIALLSRGFLIPSITAQ